MSNSYASSADFVFIPDLSEFSELTMFEVGLKYVENHWQAAKIYSNELKS